MARDVRSISHERPAMAQIDVLIELVALVSSVIGIFQNLVDFFRNVVGLAGEVLALFGMGNPESGQG